MRAWGLVCLQARGDEADAASRVDPKLLVGRWVFVRGLGLARVVAFHKVDQVAFLRSAAEQ